MLIFGTFKTLSRYHALDLLVLLYKFYAKFVLQSFFFPTLKESVTPEIIMFCLEHFILCKHSPISYQLAKIADQTEFLPGFRQQLNLP